MGLKSDIWIKQQAMSNSLIEPFVDGQVRDGCISYGLSSYGYDIRLAHEFVGFDQPNDIMDPKHMHDGTSIRIPRSNPRICIPPGGFVLGRSFEKITMPRDVLAICLGKSTYARCGIIVNVTPLEPEWEGHITLEISNTTPLPAKIYAEEGLAQLIFLGADQICEISYKDRKGKYQGQRGVTPPRM